MGQTNFISNASEFRAIVLESFDDVEKDIELCLFPLNAFSDSDLNFTLLASTVEVLSTSRDYSTNIGRYIEKKNMHFAER
jgi:hypothetical protein